MSFSFDLSNTFSRPFQITFSASWESSKLAATGRALESFWLNLQFCFFQYKKSYSDQK